MSTDEQIEGLGLAPLKPEGFVIDLDGGDGCPSFREEFYNKLAELHIPWYLKPFSRYIRSTAKNYWCEALLEQSKGAHKRNRNKADQSS